MEPSRDQLRQEFRDTFRIYARLGRALCDVLVETREAPGDVRLQRVSDCQRQLNEARDRYERARSAYVARMLGEVHGSSEQH